jgi:CVNH domain-containing protein
MNGSPEVLVTFRRLQGLSLALAIFAVLGAGMFVSACGTVAGPDKAGNIHTGLATILTRLGLRSVCTHLIQLREVLNVGLNTSKGAIMKISLGAFAALLITGSLFLQPALAQWTPQGSYRTSCTDVRVEDRTLTAVCRIADGREQRTSLTDVNRCVGDIGNDNGALTCSHGQPMAPYREDRR